jgi:DNA-binding transcriptional LysR family regulator
MNSNETIKQAVIAGMGVSFLSLHTVGLEIATGTLAALDVVGTPVVRRWYLVHRKEKRLSPAALAFRAFMLAEAASFVEAFTAPGTA